MPQMQALMKKMQRRMEMEKEKGEIRATTDRKERHGLTQKHTQAINFYPRFD